MTARLTKKMTLDIALGEFRARIGPRVMHDERRDDFAYTSAEMMLEHLREHIEASGLFLSRASAVVAAGTNGPSSFWILTNTWTVRCLGDGEMTIRQDWPFESGPGMPLDRANAAALTASMGYFLRDLGWVVRGHPKPLRDLEEMPLALDDFNAERSVTVKPIDLDNKPVTPGPVRSAGLHAWAESDSSLEPGYWQRKLIESAEAFARRDFPRSASRLSIRMVAWLEARYLLPGPDSGMAKPDVAAKYATVAQTLESHPEQWQFAIDGIEALSARPEGSGLPPIPS